MAEILFVAHRIPYPPDKGDKIRAFNIIRHLSRHHRIHLAAFVDDPLDLERAPELERWCTSLHLSPVGRLARLRRMAGGLVTGKALSVAVFDDPSIRRWIRARAASGIDLAIGYSAAVAPLLDLIPVLFDLVDCDSAKWQAMAADRGRFGGWIYRREARIIANLEKAIVERADATLLVSKAEADLCRTLTGKGERIHAVANGVDTRLFDPASPCPSPYPDDGRPTLVFTGVMNYPPNVEAVRWFVSDIWPKLRSHPAQPRLAVVGSSPTAAIHALHDGERIMVTGRVAEVQPWLAHATIAIAPLRLARGIQNKVLEAMAMALPVVATSAAAEGIDARIGDDLLVSDDPAGFANIVEALLDQPERARRMGQNARRCVIEHHSWQARLAPLDELVATLIPAPKTNFRSGERG